jgi:hypothetical protein
MRLDDQRIATFSLILLMQYIQHSGGLLPTISGMEYTAEVAGLLEKRAQIETAIAEL